MGYWRRSANLRWRKREARGPLGEIFILDIYPYKKDRNATQCDECENRMAAKKGQGLVRTALNQGYRTLLVLNVPKRLARHARHGEVRAETERQEESRSQAAHQRASAAPHHENSVHAGCRVLFSAWVV